jgi:ABC-type bacteriocin/lantibiotic exporter with double-glycine peptidase domain
MIYLDPQKTVDLLANTLKNIEEIAYQDGKAVVLPNFPRCLQLDAWTCGARSVYSILRYFGKRCTVKSVERELKTDWEGTHVADIKGVLAKHGLKCEEKKHCRMTDLARAIDDGSPVIVSSHGSAHYLIVFGYSDTSVWIMNPAIIGECGTLRCRVSKREFLSTWDRWGIVVSDA